MRLARGSGLDGLTGMQRLALVGRETDCRAGASAARRFRRTSARHAASRGCALDRGSEQRLRSLRARAPAQGAALRSRRSACRTTRSRSARGGWSGRAQALDAAAERARSPPPGLDLHGGTFASLDAQTLRGRARGGAPASPGALIAAFGGQDEPLRLAKLEALSAAWREPGFEGATLSGRHRHAARGRRSASSASRDARRCPSSSSRPAAPPCGIAAFACAAAPELGVPLRCARSAPGFAELRQQLEGDAGRSRPRAAATLPAFWQEGVDGRPAARGPAGAPAAWDAIGPGSVRPNSFGSARSAPGLQGYSCARVTLRPRCLLRSGRILLSSWGAADAV